jgi:hypothetical protein
MLLLLLFNQLYRWILINIYNFSSSSSSSNNNNFRHHNLPPLLLLPKLLIKDVKKQNQEQMKFNLPVNHVDYADPTKHAQGVGARK